MNNKFRLPLLIAIIAFAVVLSGCKKNDNPTDAQIDAAATQDAAASIAASIASNNGGALEQLSDVVMISSQDGLINEETNTVFGFGNGSTNVEKTYDSLTGWWTVTVTRTKGNPTRPYYASYTRIYKHQFLNKNGVFQKRYIVENSGVFDTAYTVNHKIVSGTGLLTLPNLTRRLLSLSADWTTTDANTSIVTVNTLASAPLNRSTSDTLSRNNSVRTLNNNLILNFVNVKGPRVRSLNWHRAISGTITGTYTATVTFLSGEIYKEKLINRTISITLGGQKVSVDVGGTKFLVDPETGEISQ